MRFTLLHSTARLRLPAVSAAAIGALGCATALAQAAPSISATAFTNDVSEMAKLKTLASQSKGKIGVLLPETTTSARYTSFDEPYLKEAFAKAGVPADDVIFTNAQGSESTELTQAQSAITQGARVLLMDPISSGVGASIESYAKSHGVPVIDYDRLTLGGDRDYYVSFNNVEVGKLIGQGMVECITAWNVKSPHILVMRGAPTDNNATLFAEGYMGVLTPDFDSKKFALVGEPAGTWDPATARTTFEGQYTAHKDINAVVMPNDDTANAVISYLKSIKVPTDTFPTTGQDATLTGLQNVLSGYQCGTVYKPIYLEAQAAAALALCLRAGEKPPADLVNGSTIDTKEKKEVASVLLKPTWVTPRNMAATVVKDGFVKASQLCAGDMAKECKADGIS